MTTALADTLLWPKRLFIAAMVILAFGLLVHPLGDPDVYLHLRDGRYWLESHFHVDREPFSYTVPDKPFEKSEWLFRVGSYLAWRVGGYNLLILLKAAVITAALFCLGMLTYRRWRNLGVTAVLLGLAVLAPATRLFPERPFVFTYLFLPLALLWLDDFRSGRPQAAKRIWWLVPLTLLWSNLHPGFLTVFAFLGAEIVHMLLQLWQEPSLEIRGRLRTLIGVTGACLLAGAVNLQGPSIYAFVLQTVGTKDFMSYLVEWQPPVWHEQPFFFFLLGLVWLLMLLTYRKIKLADLLPVLAFSYMAVTSYRNIPLFLIAGLPVLAGHGQDFFRALFPKMRPQPGRRPWPLLAGTAALLGILALAATQGYAFRLGEIEAFYPADGLAWLSQQPWEGRLLTHDIWGGFTGWTTHNRYKVFMDGRMPTFGPLLYADYRKIIWGDAEQCLPLLDRYQIEGILVSPKNELRLYMQLWQSGAWALIYWDDVCLLYVRRGGANQKLIDRYEYRYVDPKRTPYFNPSHPEMALPEIERAQKTAPRSYLPWFFLGESWMRANQPDQAERAFQQTLRLAPGHVGTHYNLGLIAQQRRQFPAAENHFLIAFRYAESQEIAGKVAYLLAANLQQQGRLREACDWAQKACQGLPNWEPAKQMAQALENQLLQGGMKK